MTNEQTLLVIAHRGASAVYPENTLLAFSGAATLRADWVELDVHLTADDKLAIHHDETLPDGRSVTRLRTGEWPASMPSLAQAFEVCAANDLGINIEIKSDPKSPRFDPRYRVAEFVVDALDDWSGPLLITSFDPKCLTRVREVSSVAPTGRLVVEIKDLEKLIDDTVAAGHAAINPLHLFVDEKFMTHAADAGLLVYPWTVDDPDRLRELIELEVDGIITNKPDVLRAILEDDPPEG